jgi:hypothetical protein
MTTESIINADDYIESVSQMYQQSKQMGLDNYIECQRKEDGAKGASGLPSDVLAPSPSNDILLSFLAGFFEAEGTIGCYYGSRNSLGNRAVILRAQVVNTEKEIIQIFYDRFGGSMNLRKTRYPWKPVWRWILCGIQILSFLTQIRPYFLMERKKKVCELGIQLQNHKKRGGNKCRPQSYYDFENEIYKEVKRLNRKGKCNFINADVDCLGYCATRKIIPNNDLLLSYLTGFFEGEGCIRCGCDKSERTLSGKRYKIYISVVNTDGKILENYYNLFGGSLRKYNPSNKSWKPILSWRVCSNIALEFLEKIERYLITSKKKELCRLGIEFQLHKITRGFGRGMPLPKSYFDFEINIHNRMKELNHRGIGW